MALREVARCNDEDHGLVKNHVRTLIINKQGFLDEGVLERKISIKKEEFTMIILQNCRFILEFLRESFH